MMLTGFAALGVLFSFMIPQIIDEAPGIADQASGGVTEIQQWLVEGPLQLSEEQIDGYVNALITQIQSSADVISTGVFAGISSATNAIVNLVIILVLTFLFIKDGHRFLPWVDRVAGRRAGLHLTELLGRVWNTIGGFIRTQALVSFIDAVLIGIGLFAVGVPLALPLALLTFFGGFIPIVGAVVAGVLAVLVTLVTGGFTDALIVAAIVLAVQQLEGNVLSPWLQGKIMQLHAAVILLSVTAGSTLFGITGAFLAVPVVAAVAELFRYLDEMVTAGTAAGAEPGRAPDAGDEEARAEREERRLGISDEAVDPDAPDPRRTPSPARRRVTPARPRTTTPRAGAPGERAGGERSGGEQSGGGRRRRRSLDRHGRRDRLHRRGAPRGHRRLVRGPRRCAGLPRDRRARPLAHRGAGRRRAAHGRLRLRAGRRRRRDALVRGAGPRGAHPRRSGADRAGAGHLRLAVGSASVRPGPAEGYAACADATTDGRLTGRHTGRLGAGTGAMCSQHRGPAGRRPGGLGHHVVRREVGGVAVSVAALVVVNAFGDVDPGDPTCPGGSWTTSRPRRRLPAGRGRRAGASTRRSGSSSPTPCSTRPAAACSRRVPTTACRGR